MAKAIPTQVKNILTGEVKIYESVEQAARKTKYDPNGLRAQLRMTRIATIQNNVITYAGPRC